MDKSGSDQLGYNSGHSKSICFLKNCKLAVRCTGWWVGICFLSFTRSIYVGSYLSKQTNAPASGRPASPGSYFKMIAGTGCILHCTFYSIIGGVHYMNLWICHKFTSFPFLEACQASKILYVYGWHLWIQTITCTPCAQVTAFNTKNAGYLAVTRFLR